LHLRLVHAEPPDRAIRDIYADARIPHDAYRPTFVKSLAMVPIRSADPIGAIGAYWADEREATAGQMQTLQALGDSASLAIDNVHLIESLQDSNRRKDRLLSMLAHELRNPLAPIRNALHVLQLGPADREVAERAREMMARQVQHLSRIVDDLLDVARLSHGKVPIRCDRVDLTRVVRQAAEDLRSLMEEAGLRLALELPGFPVPVVGDATRLSQVLGNVLDNARKFTPPGGLITVLLAVDAAASQATVRVRDTGIGIEPELLPHLFEVFSQADSSLDRSNGGLGLGLAVAEGLLQLHGGTIQAASAGAGRGTEFTLRLPTAPELPALSRELGPPVTAVRRRARLLVVEDNQDAAESLRMLMELCGYEVTLAHSGPEGVRVALETRPDIVLCDIGLPGMDGFAVAGTLRGHAETAHARLIAVTGYGEDTDRRRALEAGFNAHLVKPVDPEKLLLMLDPAQAC
jgi:signal transduction histidine kinase/CheY-like chemotaxis protein